MIRKIQIFNFLFADADLVIILLILTLFGICFFTVIFFKKKIRKIIEKKAKKNFQNLPFFSTLCLLFYSFKKLKQK